LEEFQTTWEIAAEAWRAFTIPEGRMCRGDIINHKELRQAGPNTFSKQNS
jgi:hypothetical protein